MITIYTIQIVQFAGLVDRQIVAPVGVWDHVTALQIYSRYVRLYSEGVTSLLPFLHFITRSRYRRVLSSLTRGGPVSQERGEPLSTPIMVRHRGGVFQRKVRQRRACVSCDPSGMPYIDFEGFNLVIYSTDKPKETQMERLKWKRGVFC